MRCELDTYNQIHTRYSNLKHNPSITAKPIKINWNSESGKILEKVLIWMGATAAAGIAIYKKDRDAHGFDEEEKQIMDSYLDFNEESALQEAKEIFEQSYSNTKDENILDKHLQLFKDALKNKHILRGGYSALGDYELTYTIMSTKVINALNLLGKGVLESAFSLDFHGFENFCYDIDLLQKNMSKQNQELLKKKINPESSEEYLNLEESVKKNKRKIGKLLGKENSAKRKELLEQIELLKTDKNNAKEIKELKKQIQDLYRNCENSAEISVLMTEINELQRKKKELIKQKTNLSPQEVMNKVWTIASISKSPHYNTNRIIVEEDSFNETVKKLAAEGMPDENGYTLDRNKALDLLDEENFDYYIVQNSKKLNKDLKELINLIQPSSPENDRAWKENINKKLYEYAGLKYNKKYADKIDLANCKYLNELIVSDSNFWTVMTALLESLATYHLDFPNKSNSDALNDFYNNIDTKKCFEEKGINYDKWVNFDKDSFVESTVTIKAEDAKQKAVKNMCDELTSKLFKNIPAKERNSLHKALRGIGVTINKNIVKINGRNVEFDDLDLIMSVIKTELSSSFWSNDKTDEEVDKARDTLYCHFMLQRKQEVDCAKRLKDRETVNIKVQKVDMSDIKHSISLGNDAHCCTALGSQSNEWSAPSYIANRCIGAIEVLADNQAVGNTMIYLAYVNNDLALVLDDIELQTKYQNNEKIKNMIIEYAKKLCCEIGKPDIPIYAGPGMHKIDMSDYPLINTNMEIIGKTTEDIGVYLDFDGEEHDVGDVVETTELYKIT